MAFFAAGQALQRTRYSLLFDVVKHVNAPRTLGFSTHAVVWNKTDSSSSRAQYSTPEARWQSSSNRFDERKRILPHNAYSGRSLPVVDGDVASAARALERFLAQNNIVREWRMSFRHRQKGEERRKLKSTRWRRRFKYEVSKKVELVQQIRRRGS